MDDDPWHEATKAPHAGVAAVELDDMISKMEEVELAEDEALPNLEEFDDGGLGDLQDDFILLAMGGGAMGDDGAGPSGGAQKEFPPIRRVRLFTPPAQLRALPRLF